MNMKKRKTGLGILKRLIGAALILAVCSNTYVSAFAAPKPDWGLGSLKPGEKPRGNDSAEYLKQYEAYYVGSTNEKVIFLTFDAGYENGYTENVLDVLKKHNVPATFFLLGTYIREHQDIVKRMLADGHIIGNHTMTHPDMSKRSTMEAFKREIDQVEEIYKSVTGQDMTKKFYRPPSGKYSEENMQMAKELGYKTIFWSLAYADWDNNKQPTREAALSKLIPRVHPGAVILLHNTSKTNSEILDELITKYKQEGYAFRSLEHIDDLS